MPMDGLQLTSPPVVDSHMLIRRPVSEVFQAFVDPAITTKFWFTKSSGKLERGAEVQWEWEMYNVSTRVSVKEVEENSRILAEWNPESPTELEWCFFPREDGMTFVRITEAGFKGNGDQIVAQALGSMGGFTMVLCALKVLLEHNIVPTIIADAHPEGFDS